MALMSALGLLFFPGLSPQAHAFHNGGVGECDGCHTMHNSSGGLPMAEVSAPFQAGAYLLRGEDPSSTCLNCHQQASDPGPTSYHVSTPDAEMPLGIPPRQLSPGGDFGWLKKTYSWLPDLAASVVYSPGDSHGHNIVSQDYGYYPDSLNAAAPGGAYPAGNLSCTSCHDPHGRFRRNLDGTVTTSGRPISASGSYATSPDPDATASVGSYRLLGGAGYLRPGQNAGFSFVANAPVAVAPDDYNRSEETEVTRVAYGRGMSAWCRNCHSAMHDAVNPASLQHPYGDPDGILTPTIIANYNSYLKSGDLSGTEANAYFSLVPFEAGTDSYTVLKGIVTDIPTGGPNSAQGAPAVMCLTCHRAHASGWDGATRWNTRSANIVFNGKYAQEGETYQPYGQGRSELEARRAYYETPAGNFAVVQKSLCNKCHVQD